MSFQWLKIWLMVGASLYFLPTLVIALENDTRLLNPNELTEKLPSTSEPIKMLINDWTSQVVMTKVTGKLLENLGFRVEYIESAVDGQWYQLKFQFADVQMEVWEGTMLHKYQQLKDSGYIVDAGTHSATTREDWWYPSFVEELCPGLPDWKALKKCYQLFETTETSPLGRYLGGPWEKPDAAKIRALDLPFKVVQAKNGDELREQLRLAIAAKQPIVLFNWTPNYVDAAYPGKFVEFPAYSAECELDASWGVNKKFPWDCGNPKDGWLKKVVQSNFPKQHPCAFKVLQKINFTNQLLADLASLVDVQNMNFEQAAEHWLNNNKLVWQPWVQQHSLCEN